ncbi:MAG: methyltransferase domain-containing protein [Rhizobiaceae bacterium]
MPIPSQVSPDPGLSPEAKAAADRYLTAAHGISDRSQWPLLMYSTLNLFLWHLEAFETNEDPVPLFAKKFNAAADFISASNTDPVNQGLFPTSVSQTVDEDGFENLISGLFSDVWIEMSDDIYFEQSYNFTRERFEKNQIDPEQVFGGKTVVDGGCGGGKFSATLARLGASKVIGIDIGKKGLEFAENQAKKVPYGKNMEFLHASLLDIPLDDESVDVVWSNGVIHHTLGYEDCLREFHRILKPGGTLFLYVNGRMGLFELLQDSLRKAMEVVPRLLFQHFLQQLGINSGRIYWIMDCCYAPYEWKGREELEDLLVAHGFDNLKQLVRGVPSDQIEQISQGIPYARVKYGDGQLKYLATKTG